MVAPALNEMICAYYTPIIKGCLKDADVREKIFLKQLANNHAFQLELYQPPSKRSHIMRVRPSSKILSVTRRCNLFKPASVAAQAILLPPPEHIPLRIQNLPNLFTPKMSAEKLLQLSSYADLLISDERQHITHRKD